MLNTQIFLNEVIPKKERAYIVGAGHQSCEQAYEIINDLGLSNKIRTKKSLTNFRSLLYEAHIKELADTGLISFDYVPRKNKNKTDEYGLLIGDKIQFTLSHVSSAYAFPKPAKFRKELAVMTKFQNLFEELRPKPSEGKVYSVLTFGGYTGKLMFVTIGIPDASCRGWFGEPFNMYDRMRHLEVVGAQEEFVEMKKPDLKKVKEFLVDRI